MPRAPVHHGAASARVFVFVVVLSLLAVALPTATLAQDASAGTVSGTAWTDVNTDGIRNQAAATLGVERVTVVLHQVVDGARVAPEIAQAVTDADGRYLFGDVAAGAYQLAFRLSDEFALTYQDVGDDDLIDSDANVGQLDPETGDVIRQNGDGMKILHAPTAGLVYFGIDASLLGDGADLGFVRTFHTAKRNQDTRCHGTQPFELPQLPS